MKRICIDKETQENFSKTISEILDINFTMQTCQKGSSLGTEGYTVTGTGMWLGEDTVFEVLMSNNGELRYWSIPAPLLTCLPVGSILLSENVRISDPSYPEGTRGSVTLTNARAGLWHVYAASAEIDSWGKRTYVLEVLHADAGRPTETEWQQEMTLGVDTAKVCVMDKPYFDKRRESEDGETLAKETFDAACWACIWGERIPFPLFGGIDIVTRPVDGAENRYDILTAKDGVETVHWTCFHQEGAGIIYSGSIPVGITCQSGIGDGAYPLSLARDKIGRIVGIQILFL